MPRLVPRHTCRPRLEALEVRELLATYTVVNTADAGAGSLRQAILNANSNTASDTIDFSIGSGVQTITPLSALPTITDPVTITGVTQPGYAGLPIIELNGSNAGANVSGLTITAGSSWVQGLVINRFNVAGILLLTGGNNQVNNNFLGTDVSGTAALGNYCGVVIDFNSSNNLIGGPGMANLISGNTAFGVQLGGSFSASSNLVQGNYIGTNAAGTAAVSNSSGIYVLSGSNNNTIGGTAFQSGNLISGNTVDGVVLFGNANTVLGNSIGTNGAGTAAIANTHGVEIVSTASNNIIGGTTAAARNVISGNFNNGLYIGGSNNSVQGNYIGTNAAGTAALPNQVGVLITGVGASNTIGGTVSGSGNLISGNSASGIFASGSSTTVLGNRIGTNVAGTAPISNGTGVRLFSASNSIIGGTTAGAGNLISGNSGTGVLIDGHSNQVTGNFLGTDATGTLPVSNASGIDVADNITGTTIGGTAAGAGNLISGNGVAIRYSGDSGTIQGNLIGTDVTGGVALSNANGVYMLAANNNTVGGTTASARNIIGGNGVYNLQMLGGTGNSIQGNYVGTDISGTIALSPNSAGVHIGNSANSNIVGGTAAGAGNVISGNSIGVSLGLVSSNLIQGNRIGTNPAGTAAVPNGTGVLVVGFTTNNTIGGIAAGAGNLISGNTVEGIVINASASGNMVEGNYIGTDVTGTLGLGNGRDGVLIDQGANGNTIGGLSSAATNVISGNGRAGVHMSGSGTSNNTVIRNRIGIDVTATAKISNTIGVLIDLAATNNVVGGNTSSHLNIISGNKRNGVAIGGNGTNGNRVEGNFIGTDWTGNSSLSNPVGVSIFRLAKNNVIGGPSLTLTNVISGNTSVGVSIRNNGTTGNIVQWNYIGTDPTGNIPVPNGTGVAVIDLASATYIEGNGIEFNTAEGVVIDNAIGNEIRINVIRDNGGKGIRLINNGNNLQPFPTITSVANGGGTITVSGNLTAAPTTPYSLEFFANPLCDGSGFGEGQIFVGTKSVLTNGSGFVPFSASFSANIPSGYWISATATSPAGDTSEFAACFLAPAPAPPGPDASRAPLVMWEPFAPRSFLGNVPLSRAYQLRPRIARPEDFTAPSDPGKIMPSRLVFIEPGMSKAAGTLEISLEPVIGLEPLTK